MEQDWKSLVAQKISALLKPWDSGSKARVQAEKAGNLPPLVGDLEKLLGLLESQPEGKWEVFKVTVESMLNFPGDYLAQKPSMKNGDEAAHALHNQYLQFFKKFESVTLAGYA